MTTLTRIVNRLDELENVRKGDVERKFESFAERTAISAEPAQRQRELRTRWDLLDGLQELRDALEVPSWERFPQAPVRERESIRAILVANESFLKDPYLDLLGGKYLDLLDDRHHDVEETMASRRQLIREMRRTLRERTPLDRLSAQPLKYSSIAGVMALAAYLAFEWAMYGELLLLPVAAIRALLVGAVAAACTFGIAWGINYRRARRWRL